jgi:hypothetical protein
LQEWVELDQCGVASETVPEGFGPWSQIVGHGSPAHSWYSKALLYCLRFSPTGNINTNTNRLIAGSEFELSLVIDFVQQVQRVNWNGKFFVSETKKHRGMASMTAEVGDFICIFYG